MTNDFGRVPDGTGLSQAEPVSRLGPTGFDPSRVAAVLGKAQRGVILSLGENWGKASSHQTAKRMFWGVRGVGGNRLNYYAYLVDHKHCTDNCWRLTERGLAVKAAIAMEARQGGDAQQAPSQSDDSAGRKASPKGCGPKEVA